MKHDQADELVEGYLSQLRRALGPLGRWRREQLVDEISQHIARGRAELPDQEPASVGALLQAVGDPADIANEALGAPDPDPGPLRRPSGRIEGWAIGLLLLGGFLFVVGWLVGVFLLWGSRVWRLPDKVIGTLLVPGGLASAFYLAAFAPGHASVGEVCARPAVPAQSGPTAFPLASTPHQVVHVACHSLAGAGSGGGFPAGVVLLVGLLIVPILTAVYLNVRRRQLVLAV
ncbi:MAG: HAAS signaling domain-containing protein [Acidimicrobiales bacterium]